MSSDIIKNCDNKKHFNSDANKTILQMIWVQLRNKSQMKQAKRSKKNS